MDFSKCFNFDKFFISKNKKNQIDKIEININENSSKKQENLSYTKKKEKENKNNKEQDIFKQRNRLYR